MSEARVVIDRDALGLTPLVIEGDGPGPLILLEDGLPEPALMPDVRFASSPWVSGETPVSTRMTNSSLPIELEVNGENALAVRAKVLDLQVAVTKQLVYTVTVEALGVAIVYTCFPGSVSPLLGSRKWELTRDYQEFFTLALPCYPIPVSVN